MSTNSRVRAVAKFFFESDKKFFVKGVTYGPFKPDAEGNYLGQPEQVDADLAAEIIVRHGERSQASLMGRMQRRRPERQASGV